MIQHKTNQTQPGPKVNLERIKIIIIAMITAILIISILILVKFHKNKSPTSYTPKHTTKTNRVQIKIGGSTKFAKVIENNNNRKTGDNSENNKTDVTVIPTDNDSEGARRKSTLNKNKDTITTNVEGPDSNPNIISKNNKLRKPTVNTTEKINILTTSKTEEATSKGIDELTQQKETVGIPKNNIQERLKQNTNSFPEQNNSKIETLNEFIKVSNLNSPLNRNDNSRNPINESYLKATTEPLTFFHSYKFTWQEITENTNDKYYKLYLKDIANGSTAAFNDTNKKKTIIHFISIIFMRIRMDYSTYFIKNSLENIKPLLSDVNYENIGMLVKERVKEKNIFKNIYESNNNSPEVYINFEENESIFAKLVVNFETKTNLIIQINKTLSAAKALIEKKESFKYLEKVNKNITAEYKHKIKKFYTVNGIFKKLYNQEIAKKEIDNLTTKNCELSDNVYKEMCINLIDEIKARENTTIKTEILKSYKELKERMEDSLSTYQKYFPANKQNDKSNLATDFHNKSNVPTESTTSQDILSSKQTFTGLKPKITNKEVNQVYEEVNNNEDNNSQEDGSLKSIGNLISDIIESINDNIYFLDNNNKSIVSEEYLGFARNFDKVNSNTELMNSIYFLKNTEKTAQECHKRLDESLSNLNDAESELSLLETKLKEQYKKTEDFFSGLILKGLTYRNQDQNNYDINESDDKNIHESIIELLEYDQEKYLESFIECLLIISATIDAKNQTNEVNDK